MFPIYVIPVQFIIPFSWSFSHIFFPKPFPKCSVPFPLELCIDVRVFSRKEIYKGKSFQVDSFHGSFPLQLPCTPSLYRSNWFFSCLLFPFFPKTVSQTLPLPFPLELCIDVRVFSRKYIKGKYKGIMCFKQLMFHGFLPIRFPWEKAYSKGKTGKKGFQGDLSSLYYQL